MVDPGESVPQTLKREFFEESLNALQLNRELLAELENKLNEFFQNGKTVYKGYVDDPRNTDNAWMETVAVNFHDQTGTIMNQMSLSAVDDAKNVKWMDIDRELKLYASHKDFIEKTVKNKKGHW